MNERIKNIVENVALSVKEFYGPQNQWDNFWLVLRSEVQKVAEQAFIEGQLDALEAAEKNKNL